VHRGDGCGATPFGDWDLRATVAFDHDVVPDQPLEGCVMRGDGFGAAHQMADLWKCQVPPMQQVGRYAGLYKVRNPKVWFFVVHLNRKAEDFCGRVFGVAGSGCLAEVNEAPGFEVTNQFHNSSLKNKQIDSDKPAGH
jgi:hypothetical protein